MRYSVGALIFTNDNKLLVQHRDDNPNILSPGKYGLFGGHTESGETSFEALHRELLEELELDIKTKDHKFFKSFEYYNDIHQDMMKADIFLVYDVHIDTLVLHEGKAIVQIDLSQEIADLPIAPFAKPIISEYLTHEKNSKK